MRWVEVIDVCSLSHEEALLNLDLPALLKESAAGREPRRIDVYRHADLGTDWSVRLHYTSNSHEPTKSPVGILLAALLREFGFVHHSIWKEVRTCDSIEGARASGENG